MTVKEIKMRVISVSLMILLISLPTLIYAQVPELPVGQGGDGWMRWIILVLGGIVVTAFGIIKKIYDDRITDKDNQINDLKKTVSDLSSDKDVLQKDIIEKVIPAVISSTELIKSFMNNK